MELARGTPVLSEKGRIGRVCGVVIHPRTGETTHVIVRKGRIRRDERIIDVDRLDQRNDGLMSRGGSLEDLPPLELTYAIGRRRETPRGADAPLLWYGVDSGYPVGALTRADAHESETARSIPTDELAVRPGIPMVRPGGGVVGRLHGLITGDDARITELVVARGLGGSLRRLVPARQVGSWHADRIELDAEAVASPPAWSRHNEPSRQRPRT